MSSRRLPLGLALALCGGLACAHSSRGPEARAGYFSCPDVSVDDAAKNLEGSGYALEAREAGAPVKTGWTEFSLRQDGATQELTFRIEAEPAQPGLRFSVIEPNEAGETAWGEVTERQVESKAYRTLLDKLRRDVCALPLSYFGDG